MSLNIKNERVHALAREAARLTGKSQTSVIEEALELLLKSHHEEGEATTTAELWFTDMLALGDEWRRRHADEPAFTIEELYDAESGLPA